MLETLVDVRALNAWPCRCTATAVEFETGDYVVFDSVAMQVGSDYICASAALPVAFPSVEIDGRWLVDGGLPANLLLVPVLRDVPPSRPTLCSRRPVAAPRFAGDDRRPSAKRPTACRT